MKANSGNSLLSLLVRPNLNKKVFHIKVKAQKIVAKCIRAERPMKAKFMSADTSKSISDLAVIMTGLALNAWNWMPVEATKSSVSITKN